MSLDFIGKKIVAIRPMTLQELENEGWDNDYHRDISGTAIVLDDKTVLYASVDYEGNGPGVIFGYNGTQSFAIG